MDDKANRIFESNRFEFFSQLESNQSFARVARKINKHAVFNAAIALLFEGRRDNNRLLLLTVAATSNDVFLVLFVALIILATSTTMQW